MPMSSLSPSFMTYQNISPLIKPHAWVSQYIFIFSCLRMQSVQVSEWLRSTQRFWSRRPKKWQKFDRRLVQILGGGWNEYTYSLPTAPKMWNGHAWVDGRRPLNLDDRPKIKLSETLSVPSTILSACSMLHVGSRVNSVIIVWMYVP